MLAQSQPPPTSVDGSEIIIIPCFLNDIFYFVKNVTLYNYADDNTISY